MVQHVPSCSSCSWREEYRGLSLSLAGGDNFQGSEESWVGRQLDIHISLIQQLRLSAGGDVEEKSQSSEFQSGIPG